ncbi:MAG: sulfotransferase [Candidatus Theseobacter exili]|nr:sulfotransferase [Candidatus Theseobacter exili]
MNLPTFMIIGANKAGTSSLTRYLAQHPDVFMCPVKEPTFFPYCDRVIPEDAKEKALRRWSLKLTNNIDDYKRLFSSVKDEKAIGEASTAHLDNPYAAEKIKSYIPEVVLIGILRNPIDRAYSQYRMYVNRNIENRSFRYCIKSEFKSRKNGKLTGDRHYLSLGLYSNQVEKYLGLFPDQVHFFLYEELIHRPYGLLSNIFELIGVDSTFKPDISKKYNVSEKNDKINILSGYPVIKHLLTAIPVSVKKAIRPLAEKTFHDSQLTSKIRKDLIEFYREDILKLELLLETDLSHWLKN